jgi:D-alanyl-lipoteichoic acid acyltransferase DltB (MBOAT superfamily)
MLFNSLEYLLFLPAVVFANFLLPPRLRWILLLLASYLFYACWKAEYLVLIIASTLVDYVAALRMPVAATPGRRRAWLGISLAANLGLLFTFKYFNFFNESIRILVTSIGLPYEIPSLDVLLPVGISFYTFQTLSYTVDVYRGQREPERHLGRFALYVAFFPQLVAGPIERSTRLLPQLWRETRFDWERTLRGIQLILWGLFKKLVVADRLAVYVDAVYRSPEEVSGAPLLIATYFFAFQIYCDFSGYSDIAIGSASILGYDLMENFRRPYFSRSIAEFWRRWHISLSSWFRDYVYLPLGGNRVAPRRWQANLMIVFLVSGLWHGASWTFVAWGALHGGYLVLSVATRDIRARLADVTGLLRHPRLMAAVQIFTTFHLVLLGWVFFRARSLGDAVYVLRQMRPWQGWSLDGITVGLREFELILGVLSIAFLLFFDALHRGGSSREILPRRPTWKRWLAFYSLLFGILVLGRFSSEEFIYFQF